MNKELNAGTAADSSTIAQVTTSSQPCTKPNVICSALQEIWDYIENKEYNYLNGELLNFANDIQFKIEQKINEFKSDAD